MCRIPTRISLGPQNHLPLTTCSQAEMAYYPSENSPLLQGLGSDLRATFGVVLDEYSENVLPNLKIVKIYQT